LSDHLFKQTGSALFWKAVQNAGVNIIFLVRLLILARLLSPEDFGLLAIAMTAIGVLLNVTDFGMIPALVQRPDANTDHYNTAWTVGIVRSLVITGVVFLAAPLIAEIFAEPAAVDIIRTLAILPLIEAAASIKVADLTRNLQFRSLAVAKVAGVLANTFVSIVLAQSLGVWALVIGTLTGPTIYAVISYILAPHRPRLSFDHNAAQPLIHYGRWIFLTSLVAISGGAALRVVISRQLGVAELGLYFLAAKLAFLPNEVASGVIGEVAFPLYARLQTNIRQAANLFRALFMGMLAALTPVFILMIVLITSLVDNFLGPRWGDTIPLIRLLAGVGLIGIIGDAVVPVLKGFGQPYKFAGLEGAQSLLLIVFAWILTERFGLIGAALAWFPAVVGTLVASFVFLNQILPQPFAKLKAPILAIATASGAGAVVALGIDNLIPGLAGFVAASLLAVIVIGSLLWLLDQRFNLGLFKDLARAFPQIAVLMGFAPSDV
jgi:O-antigen/teichoic acid export membrane protein